MRMGIQLPESALDVLKQVGAGCLTEMYVSSLIWSYDISPALKVSSVLFCCTVNPRIRTYSQMRNVTKLAPLLPNKVMIFWSDDLP